MFCPRLLAWLALHTVAALCTCVVWRPSAEPPHPCVHPPSPVAAQVWEQAEQAGMKSKRFTKQMLQQLRLAGWVKTQPLGAGKKHKSFGYRLNPFKQQEHQAWLARRAEAKAASAAEAAAERTAAARGRRM